MDLTLLLTPQADVALIVKQLFESQPDHAATGELLLVDFKGAVPDNDGWQKRSAIKWSTTRYLGTN